MTRNIFIKYLQGNCSEKEFEEFLLWIRNESMKSSAKEMVQEVWEEFEPEAGPVERVKYSRILDKIHHQINIRPHSNPSVIQKVPDKNRILTILTRVAAILLIPVLSLLLYTNRSDESPYAGNLHDLEVEAPAGSRMHIELGDGTKVWLNHGSKLKYPYRFEGESRKVYLTGEAYFEVAHNAVVPFIVGTDRMEVKATGTAFNVSAYPDEDRVEAALVEGKIILYDKNREREIKTLFPGECLRFDTQKNVYLLETLDTEKYSSWKNGLLVFKNDPVEDVARKLARWYNVEVEITTDIVKKYPFTATFMDETLPQVLELMTLATPVNYKLTQSKRLPDGSFSKQKVLIGLKTLQK